MGDIIRISKKIQNELYEIGTQWDTMNEIIGVLVNEFRKAHPEELTLVEWMNMKDDAAAAGIIKVNRK